MLRMTKTLSFSAVIGLFIFAFTLSHALTLAPGDYDDEPVSSCINLQYNMRYRASDVRTNGEVSLLQDFLYAQGYLSSEPSGFFGQQTLAAVKAFQRANGLTGTGYVGPRTREIISRMSCDGGGTEGGYISVDVDGGTYLNVSIRSVGQAYVDLIGLDGFTRTLLEVNNNRDYEQDVSGISGIKSGKYYLLVRAKADNREIRRSALFDIVLKSVDPLTGEFSASPRSGSAPLTVYFSSKDYNISSYRLDFGDGTPASSVSCLAANGCWSLNVKETHTYQASGMYTAKLYGTNRSGTVEELIGTATIEVRAPTLSGITLSVTPEANNTMGFTARVKVGQWTDYTYEIDFGEGDNSKQTNRSRVVTVCNSAWNCSAPAGVFHIYNQPGYYTINLYALKGESSKTLVATASARAAQNTNITPTITVSPATGALQNGTLWVDVVVGNYTPQGNEYVYFGDGSLYALGYTTALNARHDYHTAGTYTIQLQRNGSVLASTQVTVQNPATSGIRVTAPNSGEQWEIGQLNTITWAPYSYNPNVNPPNEVNVFLERLDGTTVGQIMDTGKASLHTYFNIGSYENWAQPGQYYVRVSNRVTGTSDRSDMPFTLLPRAVDIKVNGTDGPISLSDNQSVVVSYTTTGSLTSCTLTGLRATPYGSPQSIPIGTASINGSVTGYAYAPTPGSSTAIYVTCYKPDGSTRGDSVQVNMQGTPASVQVLYPNGGEIIDSNSQMSVVYSTGGLRSVSIALYKNDQWKYWITSDSRVQGEGKDSVAWIPSTAIQALGEGDNAGARWKIYITGQKSDSTGYVDDKSDAPFSFTPATIAGPVINAFYANPSTIEAGNSSSLSWSASNTAACGISPVSGDAPGLDLSQAYTSAEGLTTVSTGPLWWTSTYELRCAPLTGSTADYAIRQVTIVVNRTLGSGNAQKSQLANSLTALLQALQRLQLQLQGR